MRKVVLYIAMSLDGYIADQDGGVAWLEGDDSPGDAMESYAVFIQTVDTVLMGWNTYQQITTQLSPGQWPYSGKTTYVFTHRPLKSLPGVFFTGEELPAFLRKLQSQPGKDIWVCGGAAFLNQLVRLNLIDVYHISVIPMLLGSGIRLFESLETYTKLRLLATQAYHGIVDMVYENRR